MVSGCHLVSQRKAIWTSRHLLGGEGDVNWATAQSLLLQQSERRYPFKLPGWQKVEREPAAASNAVKEDASMMFAAFSGALLTPTKECVPRMRACMRQPCNMSRLPGPAKVLGTELSHFTIQKG
jgi:hypothetical protein